MSATISRMYKESGGCNAEYHCSDCLLLSILSNKKSKLSYRCNKHREMFNEDAIWKPTFIACKFFKGVKNERSKKNR